MKKFCFLLLLGFGLSANAQFFQGFGVTLGGTYSTQKLKFSDDEKLRQRYKLSFNASAFAEWFDHDYIRLITEVEYNRKGSRMRYPIDTKDPLKANYASFNAFLKFRQELYDVTPYWYIGPKAEYFIGGDNIYSIDPFKQIHVTGATGIGIEYLNFDPWIWLLDFQWNPDIMHSLSSNRDASELVNPIVHRVRHNAFELKLGVKFKGKKRRTSCPAYIDPA